MTQRPRLVLDLKACQEAGGGGERGAFALAFARSFVAVATEFDVFFALDGGLYEGIRVLKEELAGLVPPERVLVYRLPWSGGPAAHSTSWRTHAGVALRRAFFEWHGAALVHESDWTAWPEGARPSTTPPAATTPVVRAATLWAGDPAPATSVDVLLHPDDPSSVAALAVDAFAAAIRRRCSIRPVSDQRPRLAVVGPVPSDQPGAAMRYTRLLQELSVFYAVEVVESQERVDALRMPPHIPVRSEEWFAAHAQEYDRILYHVDDSEAHAFVLRLLGRHPGTVALHGVGSRRLAAACHGPVGNGSELTEALYASCGLSELLALGRGGDCARAAGLACTGTVLRDAAGVIVSSVGDERRLEESFGPAPHGDVTVLAPKAQEDAVSLRRELERSAVWSSSAVYRRLVDTLAAGPARPESREDILLLAGGISRARPRRGLRQLLVDVSELAVSDYRTGVQRVSRAVLKNLIIDPPPGFRVEPVRGTPEGHRYARRYAHALLGLDGPQLEDAPIEADPGDHFLSVDLSYAMLRSCRRELERLRDRGVRVDFVVYDMLPVLHPEWFPGDVPESHVRWLRAAAVLADGLVSISATVAAELRGWLGEQGPLRETPLDIGYFGLGADLAASAPSTGAGRECGDAERLCSGRPTFVVVGTVEPRKGHAQTVAAFEELWADGVDCALLIIGKEGWNVADLAAALRLHPERGHRLLWLESASDEVLQTVYRTAAALLAPSQGEGFGLPLVEAAQYALPILARDLPVFREVAGEWAFYFHGDLPGDLAGAVRQWLALAGRGEVPESAGMPWLTWAESTRQLMDCVVRAGWQNRWIPPQHP